MWHVGQCCGAGVIRPWGHCCGTGDTGEVLVGPGDSAVALGTNTVALGDISMALGCYDPGDIGVALGRLIPPSGGSLGTLEWPWICMEVLGICPCVPHPSQQ